MDPFSIIVGSAQVAGACGQATVAIIKFCGDLKTVDARIRGFYDEVIALQTTYDGLSKSLETPVLLEAARVASKTEDGAHLWSQIRIALDDSLRTVKRINQILDGISKKGGFARKVKTVLDENLKDGELQRLRQRVQFFNATISLPIQMMGLMLQLEQRGMSSEVSTPFPCDMVAGWQLELTDFVALSTSNSAYPRFTYCTPLMSSTRVLTDHSTSGHSKPNSYRWNER